MRRVSLRNLKFILVSFLVVSSATYYYTMYFVSYSYAPGLALPIPIPIYFTNFSSSCGRAGDQRGPGQRIISYSLYSEGRSFHFYKKGIKKNLYGLRNVYNKKNGSDWVMRIYSNLEMTEEIHRFRNKFPKFDWCDVKELFPDVYSMMNPRSWRFFALADPLVDIFLSRDIDGELLEREKFAVDEWLRSNFTFHVMRDHPHHGNKILAGMWGVKLNQIESWEAIQIIENCILANRFDSRKSKQLYILNIVGVDGISGRMNDQKFLAKYIWDPYMKKNAILSHDSFYCSKYPKNSRPWPSRRVGQEFVGQQVTRLVYDVVRMNSSKCPVRCRPRFGGDWTFC